MKRFVVISVILLLVLCQFSFCFALTASDRDVNHKFYGGYNTDYGAQVWSISTYLDVTYSQNGSNNKLSRYYIQSIGEKHLPEIGEGSFSFPKGVKTYNNGSLIGTDMQNTFTRQDSIIGSNQYLYMCGAKYVNYSIPTSRTAKVETECMFSITGWTPVLGTSWWTTLSVSI